MENTAKTEKDLVVDASASEVRIALMENHRLIELDRESTKDHGFSVGDVYLGRVKKILPALNAAFVDIGDSKEDFIHYLDLGLYFTALSTRFTTACSSREASAVTVMSSRHSRASFTFAVSARLWQSSTAVFNIPARFSS